MISTEISRSFRLRFWKCRDFLDFRDRLSASVSIESLDRDTIEANRDPPGLHFHNASLNCRVHNVVSFNYVSTWSQWRLSISKVSKNRSRQSKRSWHFQKASHKSQENLDLDWFFLSRPPNLSFNYFFFLWLSQGFFLPRNTVPETSLV